MPYFFYFVATMLAFSICFVKLCQIESDFNEIFSEIEEITLEIANNNNNNNNNNRK